MTECLWAVLATICFSSPFLFNHYPDERYPLTSALVAF